MNIFDPQLPHNGLPTLRDRHEFTSRPIQQLCEQITHQFDHLRLRLNTIPCRYAIMQTLPLTEAAFNTSAPNTSIHLDLLLRIFATNSPTDDRYQNQALRYHEALLVGNRAIRYRATCTATAMLLAKVITADDIHLRHTYGPAMRRSNQQQTAYQPPIGESLLRSRLGNWELFLHERADLHPLIRMAAGLFQFLSIAPLTRGNIRSAHILSQLYLMDKGLLADPVLCLSGYWLKYRRTYEDLFLNIHYHNQWKEWLEFILSSTLHQIYHAQSWIDEFNQLWLTTVAAIENKMPRAVKQGLAELLMEKPYISVKHLTELGVARRQTATQYLKQLMAIGLLIEEPHCQPRVYRNPTLLHLIINGKLAEGALNKLRLL